MSDKKQYSFNKDLQANIDSRTRKWFGVDFSSFISKLLDKRSELKRTKENKGLEQSIKLFVNTLYGVLGSKYFVLNNTVVADIITAAIRCKCWLMAKALNLHLTITDGGICSLKSVTFIKKRRYRPGFDSLTNLKDLTLAPLGDLNWDTTFNNLPLSKESRETILKLATDHLTDFWSVYDISPSITLEVKNLIKKGSYFGKAHYYLHVIDEKTNLVSEEPFFRIRGYHFSTDPYYINPTFLFLKYICENGSLDKNDIFYFTPWTPPNNGVYKIRKLLRIKAWLRTLNDKKESSLAPNIMPGDEYNETHAFRILNKHYPIKNGSEYSTKDRRGHYLRINKKTGEITKYTLFEKFLYNKGIDAMLTAMRSDNIRMSLPKDKKTIKN